MTVQPKDPQNSETLRKLLCCYLQYELHHLGVDQTVDRLAVDMGDEVALPEPRLVSWTALLHVLRVKPEEPCCSLTTEAFIEGSGSEELTQTM